MTAAAFRVDDEVVGLPAGAFAHGRRTDVRHADRHLFSLSQGPWRACLYPVYTPAGIAVTSESPVDHPHHNSVWIAADRVTARLPYAGGDPEPAAYNFFVNDTFQGRAPGRIVAVGLEPAEGTATHLRLVQRLEWRGPREWGAPEGRVVVREVRRLDVRVDGDAYAIDLRTALAPTAWDLTLGPTRHALFGVRVVESLRQSHGGAVTDSAGARGAAAIAGTVSAWVDVSGPVGAGRTAGIALMPHPDTAGHPWYVTDWGTMGVNPLLGAARALPRGATLHFGVRLVVHDGPAAAARLDPWRAAMAGQVEDE